MTSATPIAEGAKVGVPLRSVRLRVGANGELEVVDPDPGLLALLTAVDPGFRLRRAKLEGFERPRLLSTLGRGTGLALGALAGTESDELWRIHDRKPSAKAVAGEASVLDLKIELATRMLSRCTLCALRCGVNRLAGEQGQCGLGAEAFVYEAYVHVAEEPPVNPAFNVSLRGCGMRCRFCQQSAALNPRGLPSTALGAHHWRRWNMDGARSLAFVGGNPTESLPAILRFLRHTPSDFGLPVVWNSSGFDSIEAIRLLDGIVDAWIPDLKYGNEACAVRLSAAPGYVENSFAAVNAMTTQGVPVFVRILVLPGHARCCHMPALERLAPWAARVRVNVMGQYAPDFRITASDGPLAERVTEAEVREVRRAARSLGLNPPDAN